MWSFVNQFSISVPSSFLRNPSLFFIVCGVHLVAVASVFASVRLLQKWLSNWIIEPHSHNIWIQSGTVPHKKPQEPDTWHEPCPQCVSWHIVDIVSQVRRLIIALSTGRFVLLCVRLTVDDVALCVDDVEFYLPNNMPMGIICFRIVSLGHHGWWPRVSIRERKQNCGGKKRNTNK